MLRNHPPRSLRRPSDTVRSVREWHVSSQHCGAQKGSAPTGVSSVPTRDTRGLLGTAKDVSFG